MIAAAKAKKRAILADKITSDNIYKALVHFDKLYDKMNEAEKREFVTSLVSKIPLKLGTRHNCLVENSSFLTLWRGFLMPFLG